MPLFHWIAAGSDTDSHLQDLVFDLDMYGYTSLLVPSHYSSGDPFVRATHLLEYTARLKFMVALRPFYMTPAYCAMICKSFTSLAPQRLILNVVNGTYDEDQKLFGVNSTIEERRLMSEDFVEILQRHLNGSIPIAFSGSSTQTFSNVNAYGDFGISMLTDINDALAYNKKRIMIRAFIIARETYKEAEYEFSALKNPRAKENCIYGSYLDVAEYMLQYDQVSDWLISDTYSEDEDNVHMVLNEVRLLLDKP
jgi:alkanesulfonate monooxygenase SsuD/methylene tetrahydromethanopterin reductase-like flavin-dependent oxidoreductase (luciferase family)